MSRAFPITAVLATAVIAASLSGCKGEPQDDDSPSFVPKTVAFEGKVDTKFAGSWTSIDKTSSLDLQDDGTLKIGMTASSQNGKSTSNYEGKWLVSGKNLLFRYADASRQDTTLEYGARLAKDELELQQPGGRLKTVYRRQPVPVSRPVSSKDTK